MKKIISLIIATMMVMTLVSCKSEKSVEPINHVYEENVITETIIEETIITENIEVEHIESENSISEEYLEEMAFNSKCNRW